MITANTLLLEASEYILTNNLDIHGSVNYLTLPIGETYKVLTPF